MQVLLYILSSIYPPPKSNNTFTIHLRVYSKANIWLFDFQGAIIKKKRGGFSATNNQRSFRTHGLSAHTIRYYEREGLIPFLARDKNNNRIFDNDALHWLELLTCLRVTGMPLAKQKEIVELTKGGDGTVSERIAVLKEHQQDMYRRQAELDRAFKKIEKKLACYEELEQAVNKSVDQFS